MPDDAEYIERCEAELWQVVEKMQKAGVRFVVVEQLIKEIGETLEMQRYCEEWLKRHQPQGEEEVK